MKKFNNIVPKILVVILLLTLAFVLRYFHVGHYLSFSSLEKHLATLRQFVALHYMSTVLGYIVTFTIATALAIPGATILFITAAGLMFGMIPGIIYANIGGTIGSVILFLLSRYLFGSWLQQRYAVRLQKFNNEIQQHGYFYLLLVRFAALLPTGLITILSGITLAPVSTFMWTTAVGILPISIFYTLAGNTLGQFTSYSDFCSLHGLICASLFVVPRLLVIPIIIKFVRKRKKEKNKTPVVL